MTTLFAGNIENRVPAVRRGECPTLGKPMQTGDGLLARLRPLDNMLAFAQARSIAEAARLYGNGILEITARGSLQARGIRPETVASFERAVLASGIQVPVGVGVETPPLAGLDPKELVDVRPIAQALRHAVATHAPTLVLAPKLAIVLDGGGLFHLGHVAADLRAVAFRQNYRTKFLIATGGTNLTARPVAIVEERELIGALIGILERLSALGPSARGRDLDLPAIGSPLPPSNDPPLLGAQQAIETVLGLAFPFCQSESASFIAFADLAESLGAQDIRLAPGHGFYVTGLTPDHARQLRQDAASLGFLTEPDDPRRALSLCAGSRGCASAFYDTRKLAEKVLLHAPELLVGSEQVHLSGCGKGCAHPAPTPIAIVGAREGYGLVVNGAASAVPAAYVAENGIDFALQRLQALVRRSKEEGESVSDCLERLGEDRIAEALQLDRT